MDPLAAVVGAGLVVLAALTVIWQARRVRTTEQELRRVRAELCAEQHAARHDHLTGLPNRRWFYGAGATLLAATDRRPLVAVLVDLDDFKRINDTFGHRAGDEVLVTVARRLAGVVGPGLVARLGGDEFVALFDLPAGLRECPAASGLSDIAGRITEVLSAPVHVAGGWNVAVRASIGVVVAAPGSDLDEVLDRADAAMYQAKTARLAAPARRAGRRESSDGSWFAADGRRRQVRAVAGDSVTWSVR